MNFLGRYFKTIFWIPSIPEAFFDLVSIMALLISLGVVSLTLSYSCWESGYALIASVLLFLCYTPCDRREWDFIKYNILFEQRKISFPKTALTWPSSGDSMSFHLSGESGTIYPPSSSLPHLGTLSCSTPVLLLPVQWGEPHTVYAFSLTPLDSLGTLFGTYAGWLENPYAFPLSGPSNGTSYVKKT